MIEAWQGIGERECNQHRSPPLSEVLEIQYSYDTGTIPVQCTILVVPDRYHTGTHGTSTKPVRAVPVLIGTHGTGTGTDAMGRTRRPYRRRTSGSITNHAKPPVRGAGCAARSNATGWETGAIRPRDQCRGNSSPPRTRRSARPPACLPRLPPLDPPLARSLLRRPLPLPSPSRFIIPPSTP